MNTFQAEENFARDMDKADPLAAYREAFHLPLREDGTPCLYFCGNSLGLAPKTAAEYVERELEDWRHLGVEGHFRARHPWMPYHEYLTEQTARLVGAQNGEVVNMNSLTVNLHLLMVSFYRPTAGRRKILIEANAFPSDRYAVASQIAFHGYDPEEALLELPLRSAETTHRAEDIRDFLHEYGPEIALVLIGGVNYYSGQYFDIPAVTRVAREQGCTVGWDLAHAAGNLPLALHEWEVDFAAWCSYKYLNAGPGSISGVFVHERHARDMGMPRFQGWWGHEKETRFLMGPDFRPIPGAGGWQLSNPPILPMAALRASLEIFDRAGMSALRRKSEQLTGYLAFLVDRLGEERVACITPADPARRGCQLSLVVRREARKVYEALGKNGVIADWREPDVIRVAPVPLYNTFEDVYRFYVLLDRLIP